MATFRVAARSGGYAIVRLMLKNYGGGGADYLAEHFPFGWQLIDYTVGPKRFFACEVQGHGLSPKDMRILTPAFSKGTPNMEDCDDRKDVGIESDITDVRRTLPDNLIARSIRTEDGWAVSYEGGMIGRDRLYKRGQEGWAPVATGQMSSVATLERLGVPAETAALLEKD